MNSRIVLTDSLLRKRRDLGGPGNCPKEQSRQPQTPRELHDRMCRLARRAHETSRFLMAIRGRKWGAQAASLLISAACRDVLCDIVERADVECRSIVAGKLPATA